MKKTLLSLSMLTALLFVAVALNSCSKEPDQEQPLYYFALKTYTVTIDALDASDATRALALDGTTVKQNWASGEEVSVHTGSYNGSAVGKLTPATTGSKNAKLSGTLTGDFSVGDELFLTYKGDFSSLASQDGDFHSNWYYAQAKVSITAIDGEEITTTAATFENQLALFKFTLDRTLTKLTLTLTRSEKSFVYTLTPATAKSEFWIAHEAEDGTVSYTTTLAGEDADGKLYRWEKAGINVKKGGYYANKSALAIPEIGKALSDVTASDLGYVIRVVKESGSNVGRAYPAGTSGGIAMIAYVGSTGSADDEPKLGTYKGLAIALEDAATEVKFAESSSARFTGSIGDSDRDFSGCLDDMNGYNNTQDLEIVSEAASGVLEYAVATPSNTSGWFLPSLGQWDKVLRAWSYTTKTPTDFGDTDGKYQRASDQDTFANAIDDAGGTWNTAQTFWTSTEVTKANSVAIGYKDDKGFTLYSLKKTTSNDGNDIAARGFLAF